MYNKLWNGTHLCMRFIPHLECLQDIVCEFHQQLLPDRTRRTAIRSYLDNFSKSRKEISQNQ